MRTFNITDALGTVYEINYAVTFELDGEDYHAWGVYSPGKNTKNLECAITRETQSTNLLTNDQWKEIFHQAWSNIEE